MTLRTRKSWSAHLHVSSLLLAVLLSMFSLGTAIVDTSLQM